MSTPLPRVALRSAPDDREQAGAARELLAWYQAVASDLAQDERSKEQPPCPSLSLVQSS